MTGGVASVRVLDAIGYTLEVHRDDLRVTGVPAFSHLMAVAAIVMENDGTEAEVIAALLHDAAEDWGGEARLRDIENRFGREVASIVRGCSDSLAERKELRAPWAERKLAFVKRLQHQNSSVWRVAVADKLHNSRAMFREARVGGVAFWQQIGRTAEETVAYFHAVHEVLEIMHPTHVTSELGLMVAQLSASHCDPLKLRDRLLAFRAPWPVPNGVGQP